ncbi:MauE/DoxX family redox-associated membrane protein [Actinomadura madurae]|uniref:MauE/DoxX family redox-associated membrane protein n=1 Tax=Actinomadura madurae TaxID=1993 RepID=UPI0020D248CA|nr:MauE/DoxX family redox-associated membrane protein [Actinomadura madurae]MCQ0006317.1 hypothetical protein [Actinomadura madurae]
MQYVTLTARCALGLVFLVAVLGKIRDRDAFREFRRSVPGLAPGLPPTATSVAVVAAESAAVVLLAVPRTAPAGLALARAPSCSRSPRESTAPSATAGTPPAAASARARPLPGACTSRATSP